MALFHWFSKVANGLSPRLRRAHGSWLRRAGWFGRLGQVAVMGLIATSLLYTMLLLLAAPAAAARLFPTPPPLLDQFPQITVTVPCRYSPPLAPASIFTLREDGKRQTLRGGPQRNPVYYPKTEILFLLDVIQGREALLNPIGDRLAAFVDYYSKTVPSGERGQFAFSAFIPYTNGRQLDLVKPWTPQIDEVATAVYQHQSHAPAQTGLADLIDNARQQFTVTHVARRTIVVFSDGTDPLSEDKRTTVLQQVTDQQIAIDTIFINTGVGNTNQLRKLAEATNGQYIEQLEDNAAAVDQLLQQLVQPETVCALAYRATKPPPGQLIVQEVLSGTIIATTTVAIPPLAVEPPLVTLDTTLLRDNLVLLAGRRAQSSPLTVSWAFNDYPNRQVQTVTYDFIGLTMTIPAAVTQAVTAGQQSAQLTIPLNKLMFGNFSLRVVVEDEVGLQGTAIAPFGVVPPTPRPTRTPTETPVPTATPNNALRQAESGLAQVNADYSRVIIVAIGAMLLLALILISLWLGGAFLAARNALARLAPSPSSEPAPAAVPALLYRLRTDPALPLRQVVKLHRTVNLPEDLLANLNGGARERALAKIHQAITANIQIVCHNEQDIRLIYRLKGSTLATPIQVQRNGHPEELNPQQPFFQLEHNDIIFLRRDIRYRFIDLTRQELKGLNGETAPYTPESIT